MQEQIVGLLNPIIALIYSAGFFLLWLRARDQRYILALVFAGCARATGFFFGSFLAQSHHLLATAIPFACYSLGVTALVWALCERCGQKSHLKTHLAIAAAGLVLMLLSAARQHFFAEVFIIGMSLGLIAASGAQSLAAAAARNALDRIITGLTILYAAQFFVRPLTAVLIEPNLSAATYGDSAYHAIVIVSFAIMTILHSTALIAAIMVDQFRIKEEAAEADPLTGLKIRRVFEKDTVAMLDKAARDDVPVSMIVADLDHFKQVNDLWGHQAGDKALTSFGKLTIGKIRRTDIAGRIGGEEFCILVWNCRLDAARKLAERIRSGFARMKHRELNDDIRLTASFGVAEWRTGEGYGKLYARADSALYSAKYAGRDRVISENEAPPEKVSNHPRAAAPETERRQGNG